MAVFFALVAYFAWSIGDIFGTISSRKINAYSVAIWFQVFSIVMLTPLSLIFLGQLKLMSFPTLMLIIILATISNIALVSFYEALGRSNATLIGTLVSSFAAIAAVLSILFLGESIVLFQFFSISLIFVGIVMSTLDFNELKTGKVIKDKGALLALLAMICWGIYFAFIRIPVESVGWFWPAYISALSFPVIFIPVYLRKIKIQKPTTNKVLIPLIINAFLLSSAALSVNLGYQRGQTSIVAPIAGSYPTLFAVLSYFVFKDPLVKREIYGIIITLVGIVLLSLTNIH